MVSDALANNMTHMNSKVVYNLSVCFLLATVVVAAIIITSR
jgi:hypothetical protein